MSISCFLIQIQLSFIEKLFLFRLISILAHFLLYFIAFHNKFENKM